MTLHFDRSLDAPYGIPVRLSARVERVLAPNPGPFTFRGTGVYLVGTDSDVAVIDPGPAIAEHIAALKRAIGARRLTHILVTHAHADHSPAAAPLKAWSGAPTYGAGRASPLSAQRGKGEVVSAGEGDLLGAERKLKSEGVDNHEEAVDRDFVPDTILRDGDVIRASGFTLEAVATPGHTANHLCFALKEENALFSGDHVMGWSTSVVAPPDGDMADYLASLEKLAARGETIFYPTHGSPITEPRSWLHGLIAHRHAREAQILSALADGPATAEGLAARLYPGIDPRLACAASAQVRAHLDHLLARGKLARDGVSFCRPVP